MMQQGGSHVVRLQDDCPRSTQIEALKADDAGGTGCFHESPITKTSEATFVLVCTERLFCREVVRDNGN